MQVTGEDNKSRYSTKKLVTLGSRSNKELKLFPFQIPTCVGVSL